ncbi:hypothetical protein FH972_021628 [Carpinus fangiana]|uniref:Uncharacterized protein n=1 Tax=Carpinus fangiana TaxID=176857 RepID=A0A5N6KQF6_9ROSI|nr:hypothetical protein FH972_021628 [Carpinus fangiana]
MTRRALLPVVFVILVLELCPLSSTPEEPVCSSPLRLSMVSCHFTQSSKEQVGREKQGGAENALQKALRRKKLIVQFVPARAASSGAHHILHKSTQVSSVIRVDVKGERDDNVRAQAHQALEVIALSILDQVVDDQDRQEEDDRLKALEVQGHGLADDPAEDDEEGCHEERNLHGAADGNAERQVHLVLVRDDDGSDVLGCVADNGQQDKTDESFGDVCLFDNGVDAIDEEFRANGDADGDDDQGDASRDGRQCVTLLPAAILGLLLGHGVVLSLLVEEVCVRIELEVQVGAVEKEEDNGSAVRQQQHIGLGVVARNGNVKLLLVATNAAGDEAAAEDKQDVGQNAAKHARLNDADLTLAQGNNADNQLDGITKGGIHEAANGLAELCAQLFGGKGKQAGERDDGHEVQDEDGDRVPSGSSGDDAQRYKDEEDIGIVALEDLPGGLDDLHGPTHPDALILGESDDVIVVDNAAEQWGALAGVAVWARRGSTTLPILTGLAPVVLVHHRAKVCGCMVGLLLAGGRIACGQCKAGAVNGHRGGAERSSRVCRILRGKKLAWTRGEALISMLEQKRGGIGVAGKADAIMPAISAAADAVTSCSATLGLGAALFFFFRIRFPNTGASLLLPLVYRRSFFFSKSPFV